MQERLALTLATNPRLVTLPTLLTMAATLDAARNDAARLAAARVRDEIARRARRSSRRAACA